MFEGNTAVCSLVVMKQIYEIITNFDLWIHQKLAWHRNNLTHTISCPHLMNAEVWQTDSCVGVQEL